MLMPSIMGVRGVPLVHTRPDIGVLNGEFTTWTGDEPDSWAITNEDASNYVTEHADGAHIVSDDTKSVTMFQSVPAIAGITYTVELKKSSHVLGAIRIWLRASDGSTLVAATNIVGSDANGTFLIDATTTDDKLKIYIIRDHTVGCNYVMERVTVRRAA